MKKSKKNNLILDCDGVLYPLASLSMQEIVAAMKDVYRSELKLSGEQQRQISAKTIAENHLGMFNYIREICYNTNYDFDLFCRQMSNRIDYSRIQPNPELWKTLQQVKIENNVVFWSNGCRPHLDNVFQRVFAKDTSQIEANGIQVFDVQTMQKGRYFAPKQSADGFALFLGKTGYNGRDCILFDDTARNLTQAKEYGVRGVLINKDNILSKMLKVYAPTRSKEKFYE